MKNVYMGVDKSGKKIELDLGKINFILLIGGTGSGKSVFHRNLYRQLSERYSPDELGFVFLDNTMCDFDDVYSKHVIRSVLGRPKEAIDVLCEIAGSEQDKNTFIHIEEYDMVHMDRKRVESALQKIKHQKNIFVVYSTSRPDRSYLGEWMQKLVDLKVIFRMPTEDDSYYFAGDNTAYEFNKPGERMLIFGNKKIYCCPFTKEEIIV